MQLIFTFTMNLGTKEVTYSGNIAPAVALKVLQDIVIADALDTAEAARKKAEKPVKRAG